MKNKLHLILATAVACLGLAASASAITISWSFMENGMNKNLGPVSTFVESGFSLTAHGWVIADNKPSSLFSKFTLGNPGETGLGMLKDIGSDHEIDNNHFIQLDSMITPAGLGLTSMGLGSVQVAEDAGIFGSNSIGVLGTWLGTVTADGTFDLTSVPAFRYYNVTALGSATAANVLITSVSATTVPDGGMTALLLGLGLVGVGVIARRFKA